MSLSYPERAKLMNLELVALTNKYQIKLQPKLKPVNWVAILISKLIGKRIKIEVPLSLVDVKEENKPDVAPIPLGKREIPDKRVLTSVLCPFCNSNNITKLKKEKSFYCEDCDRKFESE
jgi:hypothetical protein